jgi:hypothetical protein
MSKKLTQSILYLLCLYDIYLYLPDALDLFKIDFYPPEMPHFAYADAAMLLTGGIIMGIALIKLGGKFNTALGWFMIILNVVCTPLFIYRAIP